MISMSWRGCGERKDESLAGGARRKERRKGKRKKDGEGDLCTPRLVVCPRGGWGQEGRLQYVREKEKKEERRE